MKIERVFFKEFIIKGKKIKVVGFESDTKFQTCVKKL